MRNLFGTVTDFIFLGSKITVTNDCHHGIKRCLLLGRKAMTNLDSVLKSRTSLCWQTSISCHVWMWEKNWCFRIVVLEKTLESPLDCKEIKPVNFKGNQPWIFIVGTDAEAGTPIFWPPDAKSWLVGKDPDAGKDWRLEEKAMTEDERVGWYHQLNGNEFEQIPGDGEGQGSPVCCSQWVAESDMTEQLNNNNR